MRQTNIIPFNAAPAQTTANSSQFSIEQTIRLSYQVSVNSGSFNGTIELQVSNDPTTAQGSLMAAKAPTNWNTLSSSSLVVGSNTVLGAGSFAIPPQEVSYQFARLVFTAGNGGAALGLFSIRVKTINSFDRG